MKRLLVAACFGGMSMMASAQTCTWVGHTDSGSYTNATVRWSDAARWSPCAPTAVRVLTDEDADVTARVRPTFEGGQLVLFKPLGISLWLR